MKIFLLLIFSLFVQPCLNAFTQWDILSKRVSETGNKRADSAFRLLTTLGIFKGDPAKDSGLSPYREKNFTVSGSLSRYFNWLDSDRIREELNRIGIHYAGTLSRRTDFLLLGENASIYAVKKAVKMGIPLLDESQLYRAYKKSVVEDRSKNTRTRFKEAKNIAWTLGRQLGRDLYHNGTFKSRISEFLRFMDIQLKFENSKFWRFKVQLPQAGNEGIFFIEIHKQTLEVLHVSNNG
ncbi:hypothetical protein ACFL35_08860 [Candidatus Riflebacteria bacterium]